MRIPVGLLVALLAAAALGVLAAYAYGDGPGPRVCVSAAGPVDAQGHGDPPAELVCR